jgi:hypothetical protein
MPSAVARAIEQLGDPAARSILAKLRPRPVTDAGGGE